MQQLFLRLIWCAPNKAFCSFRYFLIIRLKGGGKVDSLLSKLPTYFPAIFFSKLVTLTSFSIGIEFLEMGKYSICFVKLKRKWNVFCLQELVLHGFLRWITSIAGVIGKTQDYFFLSFRSYRKQILLLKNGQVHKDILIRISTFLFEKRVLPPLKKMNMQRTTHVLTTSFTLLRNMLASFRMLKMMEYSVLLY